MSGDLPWMRRRYTELVEQGLDWRLRELEGPNEPRSIVDGREVTMLCANNYLNLTTHPRLKQAAIAATERYGVGSGSVRAISGTMDIHTQVEDALAAFKGVEASLVYSSGFAANAGLIPTLVEKGDLIISDELNHGSIIDGVRLSKADRAVYPHNDMEALEQLLRQNRHRGRVLVITDGVFSMDGDVAPLDRVAELCTANGAMSMVDDCHGEGVLGEGGRGIVNHFGLEGQVDFEIGSFSKAFGVVGGCVAGSQDVRMHALNHSRTWLLSGSHPPGTAAAQLEAIRVLESEPEHHERLWRNTERFRKEMVDLGFDCGVSTTPIIPVMCGESEVARRLSDQLYEAGVLALPIVFPMVAKDKARIRNMMSAGITDEQLDEVIDIYAQAGRELGLIAG